MEANKVVVLLGDGGSGLAVSYEKNINTVYLNSHLYNEFVVRPQFALGAGQTMWVTFKPKSTETPLKTLLMAARKNADDVQEIVDGTQATVEKSTYKGWEYFLKLPDAITLWAGEWEFSFAISELPYDVKYRGDVERVANLPRGILPIGDTYFVNEEKQYYVWNGTAWEVLTVSAISTSDTGTFVVNASVAAPLSAPTDLDVQIMYTQVLDFLQHTEDYLPKVGENGNWWIYTPNGYKDSGVRSYGTQIFYIRNFIPSEAVATDFDLRDLVLNGKTPEVGDLVYGEMTFQSKWDGRLGLARITAITSAKVTVRIVGYLTGLKGEQGEKGDTGADGVGIASITSEQAVDGTKIIITLTDGTQSEFFVSSDIFGTITAIDFPYGEPTLTYDTTEGMHIHGVFRLSTGDKHFDVPFDQEIPLVYGDGLSADVTADGKAVLVKVADDVYRKSGGTIAGNVTIAGDLVVQGKTTTVDSEHLQVADKLIIVAKGNTVKLTSPAGLLAQKYDGVHDGALVFDGDGTAYVGDVVLTEDGEIDFEKSDLQPLVTRGRMTDGEIVVWSGLDSNLFTNGVRLADVVQRAELRDQIARYGQLTYNEPYTMTTKPTVGAMLTLERSKFNRKDFFLGAPFQLLAMVGDTPYWLALEGLSGSSDNTTITAGITAILGDLDAFKAAIQADAQAKATAAAASAKQEAFDYTDKKIADLPTGGGSPYELIEYNALVDKRDKKELEPGKWYRITDYTTIASQDETKVAGHDFDIIIRADSESVLNENAYAAMPSNGDSYFADNPNPANLGAWELKYCLDNDTKRFAWADENSGKGVIYYMKDEWGNECPYDFKNIMFKRYIVDNADGCPGLKYTSNLWAQEPTDSRYKIYTVDTAGQVELFYTFSIWDAGYNTWYDASIVCNGSGRYSTDGFPSDEIGVYGNKINEFTAAPVDPTEGMRRLKLPNIVIYSGSPEIGKWYGGSNNVFGYNCYNITLADASVGNKFGNACHDILFGFRNKYNTFGDKCSYIALGKQCTSNTFGNSVLDVSLSYQWQNCAVKDGVQNVWHYQGTEPQNIYNNITIYKMSGTVYNSKLNLAGAPLQMQLSNKQITIANDEQRNFCVYWLDLGGTINGKYKPYGNATSDSWFWYTDDMKLASVAQAQGASGGIYQHIITGSPTGATSGTLTSSVVTELQNADVAMITLDKENYYKSDNQHTTGTLVFSHTGYESSQLFNKTLTVTISTRAWKKTTITSPMETVSVSVSILDKTLVTVPILVPNAEALTFKDVYEIYANNNNRMPITGCISYGGTVYLVNAVWLDFTDTGYGKGGIAYCINIADGSEQQLNFSATQMSMVSKYVKTLKGMVQS